MSTHKIEILGVGCPKCKQLAANTEEAAKQAGIQVEIVKVTKLSDISNYGVMLTPAIVIDGRVKAAGKVPSVEKIKHWIN
jgi:small redox-active disulfide protein 2